MIPLLTLVLGAKFIDRTFPIPTPSSITSRTDKAFTVVSSNVRIFNVYEHLRDSNYASSRNMIAWLENHKADVLCLQEYYHSTAPTKNEMIFNAHERIGRKFPYAHIVPTLVVQNQTFGMAIFSKHKIIRTGQLLFREKSSNQIIYADLLYGEDTVRLYNMHLQSMSIDENEVLTASMDKQHRNKLMQILVRYKNASIQRSKQIDALTEHIQKSPYPVMVCGDLNEMPYGYAYEQLSDLLHNGFQKAGSGLGGTYNGRLSFLRIDNIFYSPFFKIKNFDVIREIKYSDHYPLMSEFYID